MTMRIVIPAAGVASRFGGVRKELLPLSETPGDTPLRRAVWLGLQIGAVVVVTSIANVQAHAQALADMPVDLRVRSRGDDDLWATIGTGMGSGDGGLLLPDALWHGMLPGTLRAPIVFGVFETRESERYSTIRDGRIVTKQPSSTIERAWGGVLWSASAAQLMRDGAYPTYDAAFQAAMALGYATFPITAYHDLGSFAAYREWMAAQ